MCTTTTFSSHRMAHTPLVGVLMFVASYLAVLMIVLSGCSGSATSADAAQSFSFTAKPIDGQPLPAGQAEAFIHVPIEE